LGNTAADLGDAIAGLAVTAADLGDPAAGMGKASVDVGDAASGTAVSPPELVATPSDLVETTSVSADSVSGDSVSGDAVSPDALSGLGDFLADLCKATADFGVAGSSSADAAADLGDAAFEIMEAARTAPAVSKAERLKLIFSPKAEWIKKKGNCRQHIVRVLGLNFLLQAHRKVPVRTLLTSAMVEVVLPATEVAGSMDAAGWLR